MSLPEIPDEACWALLKEWSPYEDEGWGPGDVERARRDLTAAWPHLYAAALRHAADAVDEDAPFEGVRGQRVVKQASSKLRRLADEATS